MKDNISLIAAAAGGFMLSVAISSILSGSPVSSLHSQSQITPVALDYSNQVANNKNSSVKFDNKL